ncbi:MAG TPA: hypothetical protein VLI69_05385 [Gammaproteobacteria bacterium]|nr:hypothetical protein [Gammaproteobacteria bacterium]
MNKLQDVFEKWTNDENDFKKKFKLNPKKALEDAGISLDEDDLKKVLATIDRQEELEKKINK